MSAPGKEQTNFRITLLIAAAAAYVDATGFLLYSGVYLSFMSGNTTRSAVLIARGDWQKLAPAIGVIPTFVLGAAAGTFIIATFKHFGRAVVLLAAGISLAIVAVLEMWLRSTSLNAMRLELFFSLAGTMGFVNSAIQQVDKVAVSLTYVTGTLVKLGAAIGSKFLHDREHIVGRDRSEPVFILTSVWLAFFIGALLGGLAAARFGLRCTIAPAILLFILGVFCWLFESKGT